MNSYSIPNKITEHSQVIKKSRFICQIAHAPDVEAAQLHINRLRQLYPDARHVCWAYIAGSPTTTQQSMSDDGEPKSTAGKPMLNVLQHSDMGEIVAIVVRYFGGIKLGTGGLVRAYSSSVSETLKLVTPIQKIHTVTLTLLCDYAEEASVRYLISHYQGHIQHIDYQSTLSILCEIPLQHKALFLQGLAFSIRVISNDAS